MRKLAHRAVIAGASVLTIMSAIGGADLLGQAHADPLCVTNGTEPCQPQADPRRKRTRRPDPAFRLCASRRRKLGLSAIGCECHKRSIFPP
jgi:hypothetical protein